MTNCTPGISSPRAAISVAMRMADVAFVAEKRSMDLMRAFCAIWECKAWAGRLRFWSMGVRRRTAWIEFVKIKVL